MTEERRGFEPPPHIHMREDETFYVLEGDITYYVADIIIQATPGNVPRGISHLQSIHNVLLTVYPSGLEKFIKELSVPDPEQLPPVPNSPPSPQEVQNLISIASKYGIEIKNG